MLVLAKHLSKVNDAFGLREELALTIGGCTSLGGISYVHTQLASKRTSQTAGRAASRSYRIVSLCASRQYDIRPMVYVHRRLPCVT